MPTANDSCESCLILLDFDWGEPEWFGSAAYWADQTKHRTPAPSYALGQTLAEELAACVLGGYGVPAEVGLAAFRRIRDEGLLAANFLPTRRAIEACLLKPLVVGGQQVRYRFPGQRSHRLALALHQLRLIAPPVHARQLRSELMQLAGVGPKTASWIVRNHLDSPDVAIIDVHIRRAGVAAGFLSAQWRVPRDYFVLERAFLGFAQAASVSVTELDSCIWDQMRQLGRYRSDVLAAVTANRLRRDNAITDRNRN